MRLNLATISLPMAPTDTCEGNSPTGPLQGAIGGRVPNQAFDAATVLDLSLSSSSTLAETASRASRHRALGGPAPVRNLCFGRPHDLTVQIKTAIAWSRCPISSRPLASRPFCVSTSFVPSHLFARESISLYQQTSLRHPRVGSVEFCQAQPFRTPRKPRCPRAR